MSINFKDVKNKNKKPQLNINLDEVKQKPLSDDKLTKTTEIKTNDVKEVIIKPKYKVSKTKEIKFTNELEITKKKKIRKSIYRFYLGEDVADMLEDLAEKNEVSKSEILTMLIKRAIGKD